MESNFDLAKFFHQNSNKFINPIEFYEVIPRYKEYNDSKRIFLPRENLSLDVSLGESILNRSSYREFSNKPVEINQFSKIFFYSFGITQIVINEGVELARRPIPSAGALYPCEIYPIVFDVNGLDSGLYHYSTIDHSLELIKMGNFRNALTNIFYDNNVFQSVSFCTIISALAERTTSKYGSRGYRFILLECGHIAQNICLTSAAEDLGVLPLGGFKEHPLSALLEIDPDREYLLYALAIGNK